MYSHRAIATRVPAITNTLPSTVVCRAYKLSLFHLCQARLYRGSCGGLLGVRAAHGLILREQISSVLGQPCTAIYLEAQQSDHEVLTSVQELTNGVQVAGVDGGFDQDVHHDGAQVWKI
jgi:hypothetical protein